MYPQRHSKPEADFKNVGLGLLLCIIIIIIIIMNFRASLNRCSVAPYKNNYTKLMKTSVTAYS